MNRWCQRWPGCADATLTSSRYAGVIGSKRGTASHSVQRRNAALLAHRSSSAFRTNRRGERRRKPARPTPAIRPRSRERGSADRASATGAGGRQGGSAQAGRAPILLSTSSYEGQINHASQTPRAEASLYESSMRTRGRVALLALSWLDMSPRWQLRQCGPLALRSLPPDRQQCVWTAVVGRYTLGAGAAAGSSPSTVSRRSFS